MKYPYTLHLRLICLDMGMCGALLVYGNLTTGWQHSFNIVGAGVFMGTAIMDAIKFYLAAKAAAQ